ncbi:MAG: cyclase [Chloroflexi bacterium]|nr:cyclase [Chloroflexota bacterium]
MIYIYVRNKVEEYAKWREGFDKHAAARQAGGATDEVYVMRNVDNPNDITVILGWSNLQKARLFIQSASLKEAMQKAGVTGPPEIRFLEVVE